MQLHITVATVCLCCHGAAQGRAGTCCLSARASRCLLSLIRWDNQRLREELERENLLKRYRQVHEKNNVKKEGGDTKLASFCPPVSQGKLGQKSVFFCKCLFECVLRVV